MEKKFLRNRRDFVFDGASVVASTFLVGQLKTMSAETLPVTRTAFNRHRFGVNYTPSHKWWFCWNDWDDDPIKRDLDAIAALSADHMRILLIWPYFQPNLSWVSGVHLERLDQLLSLMAERRLDALVTVFTGQLSGWYFLPPFDKPGAEFYTAPEIWKAQHLFIGELARTLNYHPNFLGFDMGNEMNTCWRAPTAIGDIWIKKMLALMNEVSPGRVHVNGIDHQPWFVPNTFSAQMLAANPFPVIHAYPHFTHALQYGGPMDPPSVRLIAALSALVRAYAGDVRKPVWVGEFNTCIETLSERQQAEWLEKAVTSAVETGVSWFTYWDSHDVDRKFTFHSLEYSLGLLTNNGREKEQGRVFRELAQAYGGKPVRFPTAAPASPPAVQSMDATWKWLLEYLR